MTPKTVDCSFSLPTPGAAPRKTGPEEIEMGFHPDAYPLGQTAAAAADADELRSPARAGAGGAAAKRK